MVVSGNLRIVSYDTLIVGDVMNAPFFEANILGSEFHCFFFLKITICSNFSEKLVGKTVFSSTIRTVIGSQYVREAVVHRCLNNACMHDVHMTSSTSQFTTTITTMTTYTTQPQRVGALVAHHPGCVITPVGPGKDTHGTLVPVRGKAVGGPNNAPKGEVTRHDASLNHDNRQVLATSGGALNFHDLFVTRPFFSGVVVLQPFDVFFFVNTLNTE